MTPVITDVNVLSRLVVVQLDTRIWSARKKLTPLDLGGADLPPEDLASLGSKRICNPEDLKSFSTLKARAVTLLEKHGIRFLSGFAVPEDKLDDINVELEAIQLEFDRSKEDFLQRYDQSVQEWISRHPQWSGIIANSTVSESHVRSKLGFRWQMFRVITPKHGAPDSMPGSLCEDVGNLGAALFDETAKAAADTWKNCYMGKTEITRKALSPLKSIYEKLMGLTFVEPRVAPVAELIATSFTYVPKRGPINGGVLLILQGLVSLLRNPAELLEHAQKMLEGKAQSWNLLEGLINNPNLDPQSTGLHEELQDDAQGEYDGEPVFAAPASFPVIENQGLW